MNLVWVGLGGALGALCRHGLGKWLAHLNPHPKFSAGILAANLIGCFLMGFLFVKAQTLDEGIRDAFAAFVLTGLLGSLTTYSTYVLEMFRLFEEGAWGHFMSYLVVHFLGGLAGLWAGIKLATSMASSVPSQ